MGIEVLISAGLALINGVLLFLLKSFNQRIRYLEENQISKAEVRLLIEDKIGGIHADLKDIKIKIDRLFYMYIQNKIEDDRQV